MHFNWYRHFWEFQVMWNVKENIIVAYLRSFWKNEYYTKSHKAISKTGISEDIFRAWVIFVDDWNLEKQFKTFLKV